MSSLSEISIHSWLNEYQIKTEAGLELDFRDHMFMFDIYRDLTPIQAIMKAAQITASTCFSLKVPWVVKNIGLDAIYTLPSESDRNSFVGGKVNRMIAQNPILQEWTKDKDSIEQKQIGEHLIHFRGTFTQKAAIMVPSDLNVYDEIDASKQSVIEQYATRLQHSKFQWEWYLSHPSADGFGIHRMFEMSDQKHWFITCSHCQEMQYMSWPDSVNIEKKIYQCKKCKGEIYDDDRRRGRWIAKYKRDISGYWIPLLICPWVPATKIIEYYVTKSPEYFYNKVLGLPYVGKGNKLTKNLFFPNLTNEILVVDENERVVLGIDTGLKLDYVIGGKTGLFQHGDAKDYNEFDVMMDRWPKMIAVVDGGGDLIGSRKFKERWPGRVWLGYFTGDKKGTDEPGWKDDEKTVIIDRNKMIQFVVDEFVAKKIPIQGTEEDWYEYWLDWNNLTRTKVYDSVTGEFKGYKWIRSGRDHRALATVLWRVGVSRFGKQGGAIFMNNLTYIKESPEIMPDQEIPAIHPKRLFDFEEPQAEEDWRNEE